MRYILIIAVYLYVSIVIQLHAQTAKLSAQEYFAQKDYFRALPEFIIQERSKAKDADIKNNIGICHINLYDDKSKAIPYFENAQRLGYDKPDLLLNLGKAYSYGYKFDEAISYYNKYKEKASKKEYPVIDRLIANAEYAKELVKHPIDVTFQNLGKEVNSKYPDYYPYVSKDESFLLFTSRRENNVGAVIGYAGYKTSDVYMSKVVKGEWTKAKGLGPMINTDEDEQCVGLSADGKTMMLYVENKDVQGDLYASVIEKGKSYPKATALTYPVNTADLETESCVSADGNTMYFVSNRSGGLGETDIYYTKKLPDGNWAEPINIGPIVNTKYEEAFPIISENGKRLYFSSKGHNSMGGYDIFVTIYDEIDKAWSKPTNIGYPVNTPDDNMQFTLAGNDRDGYVSCWRKDSYGDLDLYKVVFNTIASNKFSAIRGKVMLDDSLPKKQYKADVALYDMTKNVEVEMKHVNQKNGKYIFIVEPGKYKVIASAKGYSSVTEEITVYDKADFVPEVSKNFLLLQGGALPPQNNTSKTPKK